MIQLAGDKTLGDASWGSGTIGSGVTPYTGSGVGDGAALGSTSISGLAQTLGTALGVSASVAVAIAAVTLVLVLKHR